ncbi:MAG: PAS domain-containing hybrid sensor histidine kinase/response regulator [Promethearchaeota archaeon]
MELKQNDRLFFQKIFNNFPEPAFAVDSNCEILEWNKAMEEFCGISAKQIIGKKCSEFEFPFYQNPQSLLIETSIKSKLEPNKTFSKEEILILGNGKEVNVLSKVSLVYDDSSNLIGGIQTFQNISEHVTAEKMLAEDLLKYSALFNNSYDAIIIHNLEGEIIEINNKALKLFQYNQKSFLNLKLDHLFPHKERNHLNEFINRFYEKNFNFDEFILIKADGSHFIGEISANLIGLEKQDVVQLIIRDITEKKHTEENLAAEKEMLAVTLAGIGDGVITLDSEDKIILINRAAEEILEMDYFELFGKKPFQILPFYKKKSNMQYDPKDIKKLFFEHNEFSPPFSVIKMKDGREKIIEHNIAPIHNKKGLISGNIIVFRDITEKRKKEAEDFKNQKIESIGLLAGGIAHDFNNILTAVLGNTALLKMDLNENSEKYSIINELEAAIHRASKLTRQLLTFSKGGAPIKKYMLIEDVLKESAIFALHGTKNEVEFKISPDLWPVHIDEGQISQVIHNLIINAVQATKKNPKIIIQAKNYLMEPENILILPHGKYVQVSIQDFGAGISEDNQEKIFDPYFTTKKTGSGLGLSVCYSILTRHNGKIAVESKVDKGSTFTFYLPAFPDAVLEFEKINDKVKKPYKTNARILILEDERPIRVLLEKYLRKKNFYVESASTGEIILQLYQKALDKGEKFDLLILDLTIKGGMGGEETFQNLKKIDPNVKAIVASGYSTKKILSDYKHFGFAGMLSKPFKMSDLLREIEKLMET